MKKVLIISHLPMSQETNVGKTVFNLFSGYDLNNIYQVFFTLEGKVVHCGGAYCILDKEVLKACFCRQTIIGRPFEETIENVNNHHKLKPSRINKRSSLALLARDFVWSASNYLNRGLIQWISQISPDVIFLAAGYSVFPYVMSRKIHKKLNIPLFTYFMEDFYNEKRKTCSPFFWLKRYIFRKNVRKTIECSSKLFALNEGLSTAYKRQFCRHFDTLFNPASKASCFQRSFSQKITLVYSGSINKSREEVLCLLANSILKIKMEQTVQFVVCGPCQNKSIEKKIRANKGLIYKGYLSGNELEKEIERSKIVVHVESFRSKFTSKTKLALSTKIPEYLVSNRIILAIGPKSIESIRYLYDNDCAFVIDEQKMIDEKMKLLICNLDNYSYLIQNALLLAGKNHRIEEIQHRLYEEINDGH